MRSKKSAVRATPQPIKQRESISKLLTLIDANACLRLHLLEITFPPAGCRRVGTCVASEIGRDKRCAIGFGTLPWTALPSASMHLAGNWCYFARVFARNRPLEATEQQLRHAGIATEGHSEQSVRPGPWQAISLRALPALAAAPWWGALRVQCLDQSILCQHCTSATGIPVLIPGAASFGIDLPLGRAAVNGSKKGSFFRSRQVKTW
jgi:hypothetical protein